MINWMVTGNYLIIHYGDKKPCIIEKDNENFSILTGLLMQHASDEEIIKILDLAKVIEDFSQGTFKVDRETESVLIDGQPIHDIVSKRIIDFAKQDLPYQPLINFWRNIQSNPSEESKKHLFLFLEANKMPITHDGCFLAYKKVVRNSNGDLVDAHSKTFCNNIGAVVTMERDKVNPDRNITCSTGLHVAAFDYAAHQFDGSDLLEVKVNPRDVVAVPTDYSNQKMRVCRYEVVGINKKGPVKELYLNKSDIRTKRKHGESDLKIKKNDARQTLITTLKKNPKVTLEELKSLTAPEIVDVIKHFTSIDIAEGLKNLKDKQNVLKRAGVALKSI